MKKSRFTEIQIIKILKGQESGIKVKEICRKYEISEATFYTWKSKYGGMNAPQLKQMKQLEDELSQYKRMYAELAHENYALKNLFEKSFKARSEKKLGKLPDYRRAIEHKAGVLSS